MRAVGVGYLCANHRKRKTIVVEPSFIGYVCVSRLIHKGHRCRLKMTMRELTLSTTSQEIFMNRPASTPLTTTPVDKDLAEQAHPSHGIPSQDPSSAAQFSLNPEEAEREANSVLTGGGVVAGAATGAAIGALVAGPLGVVVGGTLGTVVGALGAAVAGTMMNQEEAGSEATGSAKAVGVDVEDTSGSSR